MATGWSWRDDGRAIALLAFASALVQLPFLERGLSAIDEGSMLAIADALASGDVLYRDRATFISPLMYEWMALLLKGFGAHLLVGRLFQLCVFSGVVVLVYGILRRFAPRRWAAVSALSLCVLKPLALPLWTIPNYNQLGMLFALVAVAATLAAIGRPGRGRLAGAGLAIGLTVATKLSLGAAVALACAAAVAGETWLRREGPSLELARNLGLLAAVACLPVAGFLLYYASLGALDPLIDRTLLALVGVSTEMRVPLPDLAPWSGSGGELFRLHYLYDPPPLFAWLGETAHESWIGPALEVAVKLGYYGPLLATGCGGVVWVREWRARRRESACGWGLVSLFSALAYAHTAHRLDLAHVLSIAPAPLIVCAAILRRGPRLRRVAAPAALCAWLAAGLLASVAVLSVYRVPLETPRGRLRAGREEVADASALLAYLRDRPRGERILLMRTLPIFYFLSARRIPGPFDLFLPGYFRPGEDERFALSVAGLDLVVYNPSELFGVPTPITGFAPLTARALADRFEVSQLLSPTALVLEPRAGGPDRRVVVSEIARDFERVTTGARPGRVERTSWLVYPVVTTRLLRGDRAVCMEYPHRARAGEVLSVRPMFEHLAWTDRHWPNAARRVIASVHVRAGGVESPLFAGERRAGLPGPALELPLDAYAGESISLRFCAQRPPTGPEASGIATFGWADPRILARAE